MNCDGIAAFGEDITCFSAALGHCPDVNSDPNYLCYGCNCLNGDINGDGAVTFADIDPFVGQLGSTGYQAVYTWDGENRLIAVAPATGAEVEGAKKAAFAYDYLGRRIAKQVWTYTSGDWVLTQHRRFVWSGWLMLVEFDVLGDCGTLPYDADCIVRQYTWGLDLASSVSPLTSGRYGFPNSAAFLEGAGGIGGLVALNDPNSLYDPNDLYAKVIPLYDGNGNVGQLISWPAASAAASILAHYEYDPYGGVYASSGDYAAENPVRFSTKYFDSETGLGYWGYRYYSPTLGRWVSRDPIGEEGGLNLYAAAYNEMIMTWDPFGECARTLDDDPPTQHDGTSQPCMTPNPNPNPNNQECCDAAKAAGCDKIPTFWDPTGQSGVGGTVVCCQGKKIACVWSPPYGPPDGPGNAFVQKCKEEHERTHFRESSCESCPDKYICAAPVKEGTDLKHQECQAMQREIECLRRALVKCNRLKDKPARPDCRKAVEEALKDACYWGYVACDWTINGCAK